MHSVPKSRVAWPSTPVVSVPFVVAGRWPTAAREVCNFTYKRWRLLGVTYPWPPPVLMANGCNRLEPPVVWATNLPCMAAPIKIFNMVWQIIGVWLLKCGGWQARTCAALLTLCSPNQAHRRTRRSVTPQQIAPVHQATQITDRRGLPAASMRTTAHNAMTRCQPSNNRRPALLNKPASRMAQTTYVEP